MSYVLMLGQAVYTRQKELGWDQAGIWVFWIVATDDQMDQAQTRHVHDLNVMNPTIIYNII